MENGIPSQKIESRHFYYPKTKLSPWSLSSPTKQRQITHSSQISGRTMKTCFKLYYFKSTFLKHVTVECTLLVGPFGNKNLVATITELSSLFDTVTISIYIQEHVLYLPELKVTSITLHFFLC